MPDLAKLVHEYLGADVANRHLNFYSAMGLDNLTDDRKAAALAIEQAIEKLKAANRTKDPEGFEQVLKIVRQARQTLLDSDKKANYDKQLKAVLDKLEKSNSGLPNSGLKGSPLAETARLKELLPAGDPSAPFSLTDFLKTSPVEIVYETANQRRDALAPLFNSAVTSDQSRSSIASANMASPLPPQQSGGKPSAASQLQMELRRRRQQKNLIAGGGAIAIALFFLATGLWMYLRSEAEQTRLAQVQLEKQKQGSGLPTPGTAQQTEVGSNPPRLNLGVTKKNDSDIQLGSLPSVGEMNASKDGQTVAPEMSTKDFSPPAKMEMDTVNKPDATSPQPMPTQTMPSKTDSQWVDSMKLARQAIVANDFETFNSQIEIATTLSNGDEMDLKTSRLNRLGQLHEMGSDAFKKGIKGVKATESIAFGKSGQASIVEIGSDFIKMRIAGKNEQFDLKDPPVRVKLAIANLKLTDTPVDDAVRGTMLLFSKDQDDETKAKSKEYFQKAASRDAKFKDVDQALADEY